MKGRNSIVIGIRVSDEEYGYLMEAAEGKGITVAGLVKEKTVEFANKLKAHSVNTMTPMREMAQKGDETPNFHSVNTMTVTSGTPPKQGLEATSHSVNTIPIKPGSIPVYNPALHKTGDHVLVRQGGRWVETTVPELDGAGQVIW